MNIKSMILKGKNAGKNAFEKSKNAFEKSKNALEKTGILAENLQSEIKTQIGKLEISLIKIVKLEISPKNRQEFVPRDQQNINENREYSQSIQAEFGDTEVTDDLRVVIDNYERRVDRMNISPEQKSEIKELLQKQREFINLIQSGMAVQHFNKSTFEKAMENFTDRVQDHTNNFENNETPNIAAILHETFEEGGLERRGFFKWLGKKLKRIKS